MLISEVLKEMKISFTCVNEKEINSLGLIEHYSGDMVCTFIDEKKYINDLSSNINMVITNQGIADDLKADLKNIGLIIVENPRVMFFQIHNFLTNYPSYCGTKIKTQIGQDCNISEYAYIDKNNVVIGNNVTIEPFAVIYENTIIGDNSIIRSGCKISGEGFEFKQQNQTLFHVKHVGGVIIGKDVEIQYNTCIDKAIYPWDNTVINDFVKIDNLVHVGHAAKIGENSMIVANSGIGGRVSVGEKCWLGFGCTIRNGVNIGQNARINMGSVVTKNVGNNESVTGNFAVEHKLFIKHMKTIAARDETKLIK